VLLVKRKAQPGRGLWALPGGFLGENETLKDAALRELREETRLKIPAPVLRGSLRGESVFDHPDRSLRGRTVTHAFYFEFPSGPLPAVRGADDAARARWVPISEIQAMRSSLFEDHFFILEHFLGAAW
jgi:bifunctional NMN adenylyltransferase/nudix hydrolase